MFTSIDKAVGAAVMAALYLSNTLFGFDLGISPEAVNSAIIAFTPVLVYLIPNKPWTE